MYQTHTSTKTNQMRFQRHLNPFAKGRGLSIIAWTLFFNICGKSTVIASAALRRKNAIVVGGGPTGLAAALMLAKNHGYHVTVVEKNTKEGYIQEAYSYAIKARTGQSFTRRFPEIQAALEDKGVASTEIVIKRVPSDPAETFDNKEFKFPMNIGTYYHITRHILCMILIDALSHTRNVNIRWGSRLVDLRPTKNGIEAHVTTTRGNRIKRDTDSIHLSQLIIGADGVNSKVRQIISESDFPGWKRSKENFQVKRWKSPAYGVRVKTLRINPKLKVPVGDGTAHEIRFNVSVTYGLESIYKGPTKKLVLVVFPSTKTPSRTCVIATNPNHEIWKIRSGEEMRDWFAAAFPRYSFPSEQQGRQQRQQSRALVEGMEEWERFAKNEGIRFGPCQLCPAMYNIDENENAIVLVGDAVHAFPPDLGEGVNAALSDVAALDDSLGSIENHSLGDALEKFEKSRLPEVKALVQLSRYAAPFQYQHATGLLQVSAFLWQCNLFLRVLLNKLSNGFFPLPAIMLKSSSPDITFQRTLELSDRMTAFLWGVLALIIYVVVGRR